MKYLSIKFRRYSAQFMLFSILQLSIVPTAFSSSWSPTLLVNTEAFQILDEGDSATDVYLQFGDTLNKKFSYDRDLTRYNFDDDVHVQNNLTVSGSLVVQTSISGSSLIVSNDATIGDSLTINADNEAVDAVLIFGNNLGQETLRFNRSATRFEFSENVHFENNLSVTGSLTVTGTISGSSVIAHNINDSTSAASGSIFVSQGTQNPTWKASATALVWYIDADLLASSEQGAIVTMPFGMEVTGIDLRAKGSPTGAAVQVDINENGSSIYGTLPEVDAGTNVEDGNEVLSDTLLAAGAEITLDIDQVGTVFAGSGLTVILKGVKRF